ncbi:MAG: LLM class flavin-dependent oxidoreductase, partial [Chloroflexi bacterium]|nr:LLM class flavin-dependent oxidoreductase [Chloroflexota bacterium]
MGKHLILSASISGFGYHPGAPRTDAQRLVAIDYYRRLVQTAERGLLDFVLLHDARAVPADAASGRLDALSVLARLAPETTSVGLAVSKPTTYTEPFTVSRELATLDFVSGGRAAWNATTLASDAEARNYGHQQALSAEERRSIAVEFVDVSRKLWDSWEDDAVIADRERGLYLDPHKLHHINHTGQHFKIRGPQITYRPPAGHVVVVQVDQGDAGEPLDAAVADVLILHHATLAEARQAYDQHQQAAATLGRELRVLQSILPILGATEAQAQDRAAELDAASTHTSASAAPHARQIVGTSAQVAEQLGEWFTAGAADGFHVWPAVLPDGLDQLALD